MGGSVLELKNVSVTKGRKVILEDCNAKIVSRALIIGRNDSGKTILLHTLRGNNKVQDGEISIRDRFIQEEELSFGKSSFIYISESYLHIWQDVKIKFLYRIYTQKLFEDNSVTLFYDLYPNMRMRDMNNLQKLVFFSYLGIQTGRTIFLFDEPLKYLDYEEREGFYILIDRFLKDYYLLITSNHEDSILSETYYLKDKQLVIKKPLKGGENSAYKF